MVSLVVGLPLLSSVCVGCWGYQLGTKGSVCLTLFSWSSAFFLAVWSTWKCLLDLTPLYIHLLQWVSVGGLSSSWAFYVDSFTLCMFTLVTCVSVLVYVYSMVYMLEDPHQLRFSCYMLLFTFLMLVLVSSDNVLQLFFGWEGVGVCSYLLIHFGYTRVQANKAALQALMVNQVGDIAVLLAIASSVYASQSVEFSVLFVLTPYMAQTSIPFLDLQASSVGTLAFFLFLGAVGKSAQFGLHTWLPSAMEGPTPVSAFIHAATMVTAGVFFIIRCSFLFEYAEQTWVLLTWVGAVTAFFASTVGLVQNDLKRIIAYSTCSQLGTMAFACGLSQYSVAFFHLI